MFFTCSLAIDFQSNGRHDVVFDEEMNFTTELRLDYNSSLVFVTGHHDLFFICICSVSYYCCVCIIIVNMLCSRNRNGEFLVEEFDLLTTARYQYIFPKDLLEPTWENQFTV